jgi:hypothetical protein
MYAKHTPSSKIGWLFGWMVGWGPTQQGIQMSYVSCHERTYHHRHHYHCCLLRIRYDTGVVRG